MIFILCSCNRSTESERSEIDSLNTLSYTRKYASLDEAQKYLDEILSKHEGTSYKDGIYEAYINAGNIQGMAMNYDSARVCYNMVLDNSENDLLLGIADVGMMSVCLMTSQSKEFYDYRYDAQERLSRVSDEQELMTDHQKLLWNSVRAEYHFVSTNYFLKMRQNEGVAEEIDWLDENLPTFSNDTTLLSTYLMIKSLYSVKDGRTEETTDFQRRTLFRLLTMSKQANNLYFESIALCSIARSILYYGNFRPSGQALLEELYNEKFDDDNLASSLANKAYDIGATYGNMFIESNALLTLSDYYLQRGEYDYALAELEHALQLVNIHHKTMNHHSNNQDGKPVAKALISKHKSDILYTYTQNEDSLSTEMKWILNPNVVCVADWMLSIREQLSIVYGAMGMKAESDYNHNIYFDILDATRQDQHAQQQQDQLQSEERFLNILLVSFVLITAGLVWIILIYTKRSQKEHDRKVNMLSDVIMICKKMTTVLSDEFSDEEELTGLLHECVDEDVKQLFPQYADEDWSSADATTLSGLDRELLRILQVFFQWIEKTGSQYVRSVEEQQKLESETYVLSKRFEENKRLYIEKLASMSIVDGITPFLDRALHEVSKLKNGKCATDVDIANCLTYLSELIDKINDYNNVLGHWVKIRKGMVTLNVENFALQPLFETMKRGAKSFDIKGVSLKVNDTNGVVKADKSLTIFMMNTLLDNARKYTPQGGSVTLSAEETPEHIEISVSDTGHGMSAEDVDTINNSKVYDSSKIGSTGEHSSDIKQNKGFGFGLMNCKGIIGKYKKTNAMFNVCEFGVESTIGKGSRFFFRLPKGVLRMLSCLIFCIFTAINVFANNNLDMAAVYADSVFKANVEGNHEKALLFADTAIYHLNQYYLECEPDGKNLMTLNKGNMAEISLWKQGFNTDYNLIIGLRNEIAIAALALNQNGLYHYNSEVFTRLYILSSTNTELESICNDIKLANHNKKTTIAVLGVIILCVLVIYFFLHYRHKQLFIFNLRQFIQLINNVYSSEENKLGSIFLKNLSDIKMADSVCMMLVSPEHPDQFDFFFDGKVHDRNVYEGLMRTAFEQKTEITGMDNHFYAYPLYTPGKEDEDIFGVLAVCFRNGKLTAEDKRIMNLVTEFLRIHTYFSYNKVSQMNETLELMADQKIRVEKEEQNVYVQNMIMDNCMSTLKHETMYYPNRIKQIVDTVQSGDSHTSTHIDDIDELLSYYKEIFTILSSCASKQVERVLFKRTAIPAKDIGDMTAKSFRKMAKKNLSSSSIKIVGKTDVKIQGDKVFIQALVDNILSLFFEHNSGGQLTVDWRDADGFIKFSFNDSNYTYDEQQIPLLFYVDSLRYDEAEDRLRGSQYILIKQIIRQHDAFSSRRGCRVYVENDGEGGSTFVFTVPMVK